jgi:hypothetical protein
MIGLPGRGGHARRCPSQRFSFFRLTVARNGRIPVVPQPRIEGRGVNLGYACAALPSHNPWSAGASVRIILAGNKFGRSQVFTVI